MGYRLDVCANLGGHGLRVFHHRRVLQDDRRLAGCFQHENRDRVGRDRDGQVVQRETSTRFTVP